MKERELGETKVLKMTGSEGMFSTHEKEYNEVDNPPKSARLKEHYNSGEAEPILKDELFTIPAYSNN